MIDEEWVKVAMTDDSVVADVLLRLHHVSRPPPPPPPRRKPSSSSPHLDWTVRQRRSKSAPRHADSKTKAEPTRASPTTPLSWSGATSASVCGAADGSEESSRPAQPLDASRSEVAATTETTPTKRSRKKKTLAELREEESLLLKERRNLKNELDNLRLNVEKQRATHENLKRMKLDLHSQHVLKRVDPHPSPAICSSKVQDLRSRETFLLLPDLNLPFEDDSGSKVLYGES